MTYQFGCTRAYLLGSEMVNFNLILYNDYIGMIGRDREFKRCFKYALLRMHLDNTGAFAQIKLVKG